MKLLILIIVLLFVNCDNSYDEQIAVTQDGKYVRLEYMGIGSAYRVYRFDTTGINFIINEVKNDSIKR